MKVATRISCSLITPPRRVFLSPVLISTAYFMRCLVGHIHMSAFFSSLTPIVSQFYNIFSTHRRVADHLSAHRARVRATPTTEPNAPGTRGVCNLSKRSSCTCQMAPRVS